MDKDSNIVDVWKKSENVDMYSIRIFYKGMLHCIQLRINTLKHYDIIVNGALHHQIINGSDLDVFKSNTEENPEYLLLLIDEWEISNMLVATPIVNKVGKL
jgi:hypothetical protein